MIIRTASDHLIGRRADQLASGFFDQAWAPAAQEIGEGLGACRENLSIDSERLHRSQRHAPDSHRVKRFSSMSSKVYARSRLVSTMIAAAAGLLIAHVVRRFEYRGLK